MADASVTQTRVVIIGAGFGGIGLGIKLKDAGLNDFVILEKSDSVGGVWRENRYPGAACDVPSHLYSFSFEPRADWPRKYATQSDILDYLTAAPTEHGLAPHIRYRAEVSDARWDAAAGRWIVRTRDGQVYEAQSLVTATGQLSRPASPALPGLAHFSGPVFHSAQWRQDIDLAGKRVAVIGTGATAIQLVPGHRAAGRQIIFISALGRLCAGETGQGLPALAKTSIQISAGRAEAQPAVSLSAARSDGLRLHRLSGGVAEKARGLSSVSSAAD